MHITGRGSTEFSYFSINSQGNFYVNDSINIQVFNNYGILLGLFRYKETLMPMTVNVFDSYAYVSDSEKKSTFIYGLSLGAIAMYVDFTRSPGGFLYFCEMYRGRLFCLKWMKLGLRHE